MRPDLVLRCVATVQGSEEGVVRSRRHCSIPAHSIRAARLTSLPHMPVEREPTQPRVNRRRLRPTVFLPFSAANCSSRCQVAREQPSEIPIEKNPAASQNAFIRAAGPRLRATLGGPLLLSAIYPLAPCFEESLRFKETPARPARTETEPRNRGRSIARLPSSSFQQPEGSGG
jgi:hypothetical protein